MLLYRQLGVLFRHLQPHFTRAYGVRYKLNGFMVFAVQRFLHTLGQRKIADDDIGFGFTQIMLGDKGFAVFLNIGNALATGCGEKAFIADMSPATYTHPMHAHHTALCCQRQNIDILRTFWLVAVYILLRLHHAQGLNLIAITSSFFKVQRFRRLLHFVVQRLAEFIGFSVEKGNGLLHIGLIILFADVADARA